jgi:hypothetical protein
MSANPAQHPNRKVIGKETQKLRVDLTEFERRRANEDLIGCLSDLAAHEREATEVKAQLARKQKGLEARRGNLHQLIVAGYEYRDVEVEKIADYDAGLIRLCRVDTGAEVDVERMPEGVRQQELDLREKRDAEANRPTNPDDVDADADPWGAPSDGRAPVAELPHDPDVIDADIVDDGDGEEASDLEGGDTEDDGEDTPAIAESSVDARLFRHAEWLKTLTREQAQEQLDSDDVDNVRALYTLVMSEPAGRAQKRTMIPKILDRLFQAPF